MQAKDKCGSCTETTRLVRMKWSLFPGARREIAGLGKPGQTKWNFEIAKWRKGVTFVVGNRGWWQTMTGMERKVAERSAALK